MDSARTIEGVVVVGNLLKNLFVAVLMLFASWAFLTMMMALSGGPHPLLSWTFFGLAVGVMSFYFFRGSVLFKMLFTVFVPVCTWIFSIFGTDAEAGYAGIVHYAMVYFAVLVGAGFVVGAGFRWLARRDW